MQTLRAYFELLRYEIAMRFGGFKRVHDGVKAMPVAKRTPERGLVPESVAAVETATCFFWKPMLCLPRAVALTRLLRRQGVDAEMVIGYRPSPFMSHAWVEVDGAIVNDSPEYQKRLLVLERI